MNHRKFLRMIKSHGRVLDRSDGKHDVYRKGIETVAVPGHNDVSPGIAREWHEKNERADQEEES